jgi:excinuclease ABC subunit C
MDRRLRELAASVEPVRVTIAERQEHLAILARWFYSSWRDGEWVRFESLDRLPFRKVVGAISRTADRI